MKLTDGQKQMLARSGVFIILLLLMVFCTDQLAKAFGMHERFFVNVFHIGYLYAGVIIAFLAYAKDHLKSIEGYRQSITQTILFGYFALMFLAMYFIVKYSYLIDIQYLGQHIYMATFLSYGLGFLTVLFMALATYNIAAFRVFFREVSVSTGITVCFFCFALVLRHHWMMFASGVTRSSTFLLSLTNSNVNMITGAAPSIIIDNFSASIGAPCSGIESIAMFTGIFTLLILYDLKTINLKRVPAFFLVGLTGMYGMSIIRIYSLFYVGKYDADLAMSLFHTNLGWTLFVFYVLAYMYLAYPKIRLIPNG